MWLACRVERYTSRLWFRCVCFSDRPWLRSASPSPRLLLRPFPGWRPSGGHVRTHGVGRDGYLLHAHHGGHVLDSNYRIEFRHAVIGAGYEDEIRAAHTLRHFFASSAIAGGLSLLKVLCWLGHAMIQITADIYGHLTPDAGAKMRSVMDGVLAETKVVRADA
ncbi:tyrosine-type recombinase/integrase [Streptomyces sp. Ac-502]|uniref:tyrosine-type recombinase/integrase n=1 Tax=Streptomyces sp. Ac-502 TaxID=3342801 RepID=UPI00386273E5